MMTINPNSMLYKISKMLSAFKAIYQFSPQQVDAFVKAYDIYDCDWEDGQAMHGSKKIAYPQVKKNILNWYEVINHLCAIGELEKMYIPPTLDLSQSLVNNQILFETKFAKILGLKSNDHVFELGCGKGRVAAHIASITGAHITGINIDQSQLNSAIHFAKDNALTSQCEFINADFNDLPFPYPDNHFDAVYEIQVLSLSRDLQKLFKELYRIMKPSGKISLLEWVQLPNYDKNNAHHQELMKQIKPLVGAIGTPSIAEYEAALKKAGFKLLLSENPNTQNIQEPFIRKAGKYFDKAFGVFKFLVTIKLLPPHFVTLFERLGRHTDALCEADKLGLITMSYHLVAQKPKLKKATVKQS